MAHQNNFPQESEADEGFDDDASKHQWKPSNPHEQKENFGIAILGVQSNSKDNPAQKFRCLPNSGDFIPE